MLKIKRYTEHRELTLDEFIAQKNSHPFKDWRHIGKICNFLLIFGGSEMLFSEQALETNWDREQAVQFCEENNCVHEEEQVRRKYRGISDEEVPFVTAATYIRNGFFEGYEGLMNRIVREKNYGKTHGFIRSPFGHVRKVAELKYQGEHDKVVQGRMFRNLENICANSNIQNMEAAITKIYMVEIQNWLKENNMKSWVWNEIHDSIDIYVYKPELEVVLKKVKEICERPVPEMSHFPVPLTIDCEISDLNKGQYYKGGSSPASYGIEW